MQAVVEVSPDTTILPTTKNRSYRREWISVGILFFVNLLNYMDRVTIASVLSRVQLHYKLDGKQCGFLQTVFIVSYMVFAPLFGFLGDRFTRKYLMATGVLFWSITTFLASLPPKDFYVFLILRGLFGVGEASYSTIAPTLIGDMFPEDKRTLALGVFYYAIPIGSGIGYMIGSNVAILAGNWVWALRVTPPLGLLATVLIVSVLREPPRGEADGGIYVKSTPISEDIKDLCHNCSYIWSTLGFTGATFAIGAMSWWAPEFMERAERTWTPHVDTGRLNLIFGAITCLAGAVGITLAVVISKRLRSRLQRIDPIICTVGLLFGVPLISGAVLTAQSMENVTWVLFFCGLIVLSLNWSAVPDMLLYTVLPTRRSTASAMQILISHLFGDASSPYIIGAISDAISCDETKPYEYFHALQVAMLVPCCVLVLGAIAFGISIFTITRDKQRYQKRMQGVPKAG